MILWVNMYIMCKIRLKTRKPTKLVKIGQIRSKSIKLNKICKIRPILLILRKVKKFTGSLSLSPPTLHNPHSPVSSFLFTQISNSQLSQTNTKSIANSTLHSLSWFCLLSRGAWRRLATAEALVVPHMVRCVECWKWFWI